MLLKDGQKLVDSFLAEHFTEIQRAPSRFQLLKWSVNKAREPGLFLEFGVWKGDSLKFLANVGVIKGSMVSILSRGSRSGGVMDILRAT